VNRTILTLLLTLPLLLSAVPDPTGTTTSFPLDNYTPFGYLDNPYHSFVLNPSGAIRSVPPLGYGFWCRKLPWPYGEGAKTPINYLSFLPLSVAQGKVRLHTVEDFVTHGVELNSQYHSKNIMSYNFEVDGLIYDIRYFLSSENTLVAKIKVENRKLRKKRFTLHATNIYGYPETRWWGSDGVTAANNAEIDLGVSKIWAYGDVFTLGSDEPASAFKATADEVEWNSWISDNDLTSNDGASVRMPGPLYAVKTYDVEVGGRKDVSFYLVLTRGKTESANITVHQNALRNAQDDLEQFIQNDNSFYALAPALTGDWPASWRHGWIYDWETLRMNIRNPLGNYKHHWDAMQPFTPRVVLGETAIDAMCMSYSDMSLAKDMLLGVFADALAPNLPCSREDGSVNMIGADGLECGTAPIWGMPFFVINSLYTRDPDPEWLAELYPHLKTYLDWWLENRTDDDGWFHAANSWESGQDGSRRFLIPNHDPGAAASFVRTVDIEAAMAHAMTRMQDFAEILENHEDVSYWKGLTTRRVEAARSMFVDGWFRDFDARNNEPIILEDYYDIMMFLPVSLGIASDSQMQEIHPMFHHFRNNPIHFMEWPSFLFPFTEAAWNSGLRLFTAEEVAKIGNRSYPRHDERAVQPVLIGKYEDLMPEKYSFRIPGVADEFWPIRENNPGGCENYGWGSTFPTLVTRNIIGYREHLDPFLEGFLLCPALPENLVKSGQTLGMDNLCFQDKRFDISYTLGVDDKVLAHLQGSNAESFVMQEMDGKIVTSKKLETGLWEFNLKNGEKYAVTIQ